MELRRYFAILRNRALLIVLTVIAGLVMGYITTNQTPRYTANATIYVGQRQLPVAGAISNDNLTGLQRISATFAEMIHSYPVASDAVTRARAGRSATRLLSNLKAVANPNTQLLNVSVTDSDPAVAQALVNAVVDSFVEKIEDFEPGKAPAPGDPPTLPAYVFEHARLPSTPQDTGIIKNVILDGAFGLVAALALAFLLDYLDVTIKTAAEAERRLELPVLGVIPMEAHADLVQSRVAHVS